MFHLKASILPTEAAKDTQKGCANSRRTKASGSGLDLRLS